MEDNAFIPGFEDESKNIGVDFDGVIYKNSKGFYDGTLYDEPVPGAIEAIKELAKDYVIIIFTAKAKPDRPLVGGKTGIELIWEWLKKYDIAQYIKEVTSEKPRAILYIDDNGYRFNNWESTLDFVSKL
jgi:hypothetical protein